MLNSFWNLMKAMGSAEKHMHTQSIVTLYLCWPIKTVSRVYYIQLPPNHNRYKHGNLDFALWNSGSENFPVPMGIGRQENDYETTLLSGLSHTACV